LKFSKNIIYCILFVCFALSLLSASSYNPHIKNNIIYNVVNNTAFVNLDKENLYKYKSGTISHSLNFKQNLGTNSVIIAKATIYETHLKYAKIRFSPIQKIKPKILYDISQSPQNGDRFTPLSVRNLYILIAPNYDTYAFITNHYTKARFLPIDLFAMNLKSSNQALPTKSDFTSFCVSNSLSDIVFLLQNELVFVDCYSFKPYKSIKLSQISNNAIVLNAVNNKSQMPFFTNVEEIKNSIFDFSYIETNYTKYYKKLLGI